MSFIIINVSNNYLLLKEQQNLSENYFCVRRENRRKHNRHFKLLFFKQNSYLGPSNYIPACRKLALLHRNSTYLVVSAT